DSMKAALDETGRRRAIQEQYNQEHGITPTTITKAIRELAPELGYLDGDYVDLEDLGKGRGRGGKKKGRAGKDDVLVDDIPQLVEQLREEMNDAARELEFEKAASLRDRIKQL